MAGSFSRRVFMRSTDGQYFSRLDHVRAVAAYLVFIWHFLHMTPQFPVPYASAPVFPFALFDEGHTGVALFMTLSGYLFARLVGNHEINLRNFFWSRTVRLGPLVIVCLAAWWAIGWLRGDPLPASDLLWGFLLPTWPKGAWSIAIELHFYLLFPFLLMACRRFGPKVLLAVLAAAIIQRINWWVSVGEVQHLAYWTIAGRIDQFLLGMFFALVPLRRAPLAAIAAVSMLVFLIVWDQFDRIGGFHNRTGEPSESALWIAIPTIEAITYASLIAWYDGSSLRLPGWLDRGLATVGEWSFSIYLLHFFPIVLLRALFDNRIGSAEHFFPALALGTLAFLAFLPIAGLSYVCFERKFLAYRKPYLRKGQVQVPVSGTIEPVAARS